MALLYDGAQWRARAKEVRDIAESLPDLLAKRELLEIAEKYERLAARADARGDPQGGDKNTP